MLGPAASLVTRTLSLRKKHLELQEAMELKSAMSQPPRDAAVCKAVELEQAELEKALAMSLQLEERRLEKLKLEQELAGAQAELQSALRDQAKAGGDQLGRGRQNC